MTLLTGPLGYTAMATLPPTAIDWLLRADEQVDSLEDWYKNVTDRKKDAAACEHGITLRRLRAAYPDVLTVLPPPSPTETIWTTRGHGATAMQARPAPVLDLHAWHLTSFSQLAHGRHNERDHRDAVAEPDDAGAIGAVADAMDADVPLATFARGTHAGNCLHQLLEQWDFHEDTAVLVDRSLRRHRLYSTEAADAVRHTLAALKTTRLDGLDARLDTAASNKTLSEWEFLLPLGRAGITGQALSDIFARHARTTDERHYAQDLAGLPSQALAGMLTGYIDRLVRTDGRWGVVDWKSNYLGSRVADYSRQALWRCAARQHYLLQLHFYLVALRRYLQLYDSGGTAVSGSLLFVRGVRPGTSQGVLEIMPSEPLLDELDRLFAIPDRGVPS